MKQLLQIQRGILLAVFSFLCVISINAQTTWTAPALTGSTVITGTTYYVYNVGSMGYLTAGGAYGTQSVVSAQPRANESTSVVKYTATNTSGSLWTFQYNLAGSNVTNWFLTRTTDDAGNGSVETNDYWYTRGWNSPWTVVPTDAPNNIYSIQVPVGVGGHVDSQYLGSATGTENTNRGPCNVVRYNRAASVYTQWKFVSQANLDLYNARILLDKYMTYAKNKAIDISSDITTYNAGVTADINSAAATLLTALGRTSITVPNFSFESNALTSWTTSGGFTIETNDPGQVWTKDGTYYVQKFTSTGNGYNANFLAAGSITQTVSGLSSGMYELVVSGDAVQQGGSNPLHTGAYIIAGSQSTEVVAGKDYSISNIAVMGSTLDIGYALSGTIACNWAGFDNFRLYYYGSAVLPATQAELDALQVQIAAATALLASTTEGTAPGQYTTANRAVLSDVITSATTVYNTVNAPQASVNSATSSLSAAMTTYSNSMNIATNQLANGDYFIKLGGMYVNDPGSSSIGDGTTPQISNNGLQSQIIIANGSQIYTIAKVTGCGRINAIDRYSFFNAATSRNLNECAAIRDTWTCFDWGSDDTYRTQNIYYNGTNYAIQAAEGSAGWGMWYLKNGNELTANSIVRTPIAVDYAFELVPVSTVFSQQVVAGRTAFNAVTPSDAVGQYNAAKCSAFQTALETAEGITAGTATKENLYAYSAALQLFVANANLTFAGDANWSNTANWSASRLPNSGDYVTVSSGTLAIDQNVTVHNLTINSGAKVTLNSGNTLSVTGNFAINSDATGTGTFVDVNEAGGLSVGGTSTVQQYLTGATATTAPSGRFWYVSSPVTGATSGVFDAAGANKLWSYSETAHAYNTEITDNTTELAVGTGYAARLGANATVTFTGALNTGSKTFNLTRADDANAKRGFNLIGNPYPSYLDIDAAFLSASTTSLESTIWHRSFNSGTGIMAFDTYNANWHTGISLSGGTELTKDIPPMQAFWVRATTNGVSGNLALTNAMRSNQASGNKLRSAMADTIRIEKIRLQITNGRGIDQALIGIYPQAKDSFERYDSHKMFNDNDSIPEIYTFAGKEEVAINGLAPFVGRKDMKLGFRTRKPGRFTIKALELSNLEAGTKILLKDNVLNVSQDLTETPEYTFVSDAAATTDRFTLTLVKAATAIGNTQKSSISIRSLNGGRMEINLEGSNKANVKVYDMIGKMVFAQDVNSQNSTLSKTFSKGVYLVKVSVNGMEFAKKVAINQ